MRFHVKIPQPVVNVAHSRKVRKGVLVTAVVSHSIHFTFMISEVNSVSGVVACISVGCMVLIHLLPESHDIVNKAKEETSLLKEDALAMVEEITKDLG